MRTLDKEWQPPSAALVERDNIWIAPTRDALSYPEHANDALLAIEDHSYWFRHRLAALLAVMDRFPPTGEFYDIGGGNGYTAASLVAAGIESVLVEPGSGALNARRRGVRRIVQATLDGAAFRPGSLAAAGAFDVIEHIADDAAFLRQLRACLRPGGRFYCTVPAEPILWSNEDVAAGHFRRYRARELAGVLRRANFDVEFVSPIFSWLVLPVFLFRALPSRVIRARVAPTDWSAATAARDHRLPRGLAPFVARIHAHELRQLRTGHPLSCGTSILAVARASS